MSKRKRKCFDVSELPYGVETFQRAINVIGSHGTLGGFFNTLYELKWGAEKYLHDYGDRDLDISYPDDRAGREWDLQSGTTRFGFEGLFFDGAHFHSCRPKSVRLGKRGAGPKKLNCQPLEGYGCGWQDQGNYFCQTFAAVLHVDHLFWPDDTAAGCHTRYAQKAAKLWVDFLTMLKVYDHPEKWRIVNGDCDACGMKFDELLDLFKRIASNVDMTYRVGKAVHTIGVATYFCNMNSVTINHN